MDDVEGLKASMEDVTPDVVEVGSILELEWMNDVRYMLKNLGYDLDK